MKLSPYTAARTKAYRSTEIYKYFLRGWVNNAAIWEVKYNKIFIVTAKVSAS